MSGSATTTRRFCPIIGTTISACSCVTTPTRFAPDLSANLYAGWLFINLLWVDAGLRRHGIGSALIAEAERRATAFGCHSAHVDTFSFQGPEFYPKFGYEVFGTIDYPPDHKRIFLRKKLIAEEA